MTDLNWLSRFESVAAVARRTVKDMCFDNDTGTDTCAKCDARNWCKVRDLAAALGIEGKVAADDD